jgi:hypothetical protein
VRIPETSNDLTLHHLWQRARQDLASNKVIIEFSRDVIQRLTCPKCRSAEEVFAAVGRIPYDDGACPRDGQMRVVEQIHLYSGQEPFGHRKLSHLGLPLFDIFVARSFEREIGYLVSGDAETVLGPLAEDGGAYR